MCLASLMTCSPYGIHAETLRRHERSGPVRRPAVIVVQPTFIVPIHWCRSVKLRTALYLVARQVDMHQRLGPVHMLNLCHRYQYLLARPPVHRIYDHIADGPGVSVDDEVLDVPDLAIVGLYIVAKHVPRTMQVRIALLLLGEFIRLSHEELAWVRSGGMRPQGSASRPVGRPVIIGV